MSFIQELEKLVNEPWVYSQSRVFPIYVQREVHALMNQVHQAVIQRPDRAELLKQKVQRILPFMLGPKKKLSNQWPMADWFASDRMLSLFGVTHLEFRCLYRVLFVNDVTSRGLRFRTRQRYYKRKNKTGHYAHDETLINSNEYVNRECAILILLASMKGHDANELQYIFSHDLSTILRIINTTIHLLHSHAVRAICVQRWVQNPDALRVYAEAMNVKAGKVLQGCVGSLDGTRIEIRRPQVDQRGHYSGYVAVHCMHFQGISTPDGMLWVDGPAPGRVNDCGALRDSVWAEQLAALHKADDPNHQYYLISDGIYPLRYPWLHSTKSKGGDSEDEKRVVDETWRLVRSPIEHCFGTVVRAWHTLADLRTMQLGT